MLGAAKLDVQVYEEVEADTGATGQAMAPALGGVYKLVEVERGGTMVPVAKLSPDKATYPRVKQVWRVFAGGQGGSDGHGGHGDNEGGGDNNGHGRQPRGESRPRRHRPPR